MSNLDGERAFLFVLFVVGLSALLGLLFMLLWNFVLVSALPFLPVLDFLKAWGLSCCWILLAKMLRK